MNAGSFVVAAVDRAQNCRALAVQKAVYLNPPVVCADFLRCISVSHIRTAVLLQPIGLYSLRPWRTLIACYKIAVYIMFALYTCRCRSLKFLFSCLFCFVENWWSVYYIASHTVVSWHQWY